MNRHASRLVDGQQMLVFQQHRKITRRHEAGRALLHRLRLVERLLRHAHRRHAQHIAQLKPGISLDTPLVDAHLAGTDHAVDMGFGNAFKVAHQKIVHALAIGVFVDANGLNLRQMRIGFAPYNGIHWRRAVSC